MTRRLLFPISALIGASVVTLVSQSPGLSIPRAIAASPEIYWQLSLFGDVFAKVRTRYVERPDEAKLIEGALSGMLTSLDPHSAYLSSRGFQAMQTETHGAFGGIGIEATIERGLLKVIAPMDESPAARAGILPGDLITRIDGEAVQGLTLNQAADKLRGPLHSSVRLTIQRKDEEPIEVTLPRE